MIKKIIYLSNSRLEYALNSVCIKGLRENGVEVLEFGLKGGGAFSFLALWSFYRRNSKNTDTVIVGYDSPGLVIFLRFFCRKKIIYNAVLSVYERMIVSRALASRFSVKAGYYWLLDFIAVHISDLIVVESDSQADYFKKLFKVNREKVFRNWIGVDEDKFFYDSSTGKLSTFAVLFRGAFLPETGVEYLVRAAKILENNDIEFIVHGGGGQLLDKIKKMIDGLRLVNLKLTSNFVPVEELRGLMQKCHLSIGQLSDHERLERTIPHKVYESLVMRLPYLTASNRGILELLEPGKTCITCEPANAQSLAQKILWAKNNPQELERIAENGYRLYQEELKSEILAKNLLDRIKEL
ncbi:MAG: hypothetical protein A3F98_01805 [Candidatus Yanofskybacteria bacterium RIFCSPLOWO2_12_FULL_41_8]|uniref:Glycosyl transferase family 1 domain-containing protein n=1 Tax=Candidatus Yanofskybacteria bacterium RIFCSPHIGHO2_01_FULL_41_53 TaxID=1802663 RepID=A0A1F8EJD2_9BACT|nr:MAG: hypothetical protein A2650_02105 [Candidatus Yanofskybacteria bacterium RIFCSPHIGHO2_01_FULL_41_53]OGN30455.1 MAG: hypothetical protein A3H54_00290 [Candidatus Yanofskybacteria bacterium RIFCSPLOWO2_02_FULL_41_13]OGN34377.1 MAG: hypothetical protein A3F98_01805 [Candidatus Yanofskybacteria bacterium RIFCSPLOWO2_12_FULL_41_8]